MTHLTEEERQNMADGSLSASARTAVDAHLAACPECAGDVQRIRTLLTLASAVASAEQYPEHHPEHSWLAIKARIDQGKLVSLPIPATVLRPRLRWQQAALGAAAAAIIIAAFLRTRTPTDPAPVAVAPAVDLTAASESTTAYREQVDELLADLKLRRAMLDPAVLSAADRDLRVVDQAIAELNTAITHDPANPGLRQMLAATYRRKLDILKRLDNAS